MENGEPPRLCPVQNVHLNILANRGSIESYTRGLAKFPGNDEPDPLRRHSESREVFEAMRRSFSYALMGILLALALLASARNAPAQQQQQPPPPNQQQTQSQQSQQPKQQPPGGFSISVTVPVVTVDVVVTDNEGNYLSGLKKENFRVLEDGQTQTITNFGPTDAPITMVMLLEFSQRGWYANYAYNAINWAAAFLNQLKPNDWVALETFSMRTNIEVDFTHNRQEVLQALSQLIMPEFHEANLFDALTDTVDRMKDVKGKKAILLLAQGVDTFSKINLDQTIKALRQTDVTIFCVGVGELQFINQDAGGMGSISRMNYYQAQNQMKNFAAETGGRAWFPRFDGEIPGIMQDVASSLRNQYSLAYTPTNQAMDGKYRKIKVELVAPDGGPLTVLNQKGKKVKFQVYAREGYTAPKSNVGP